MCGLFGYSTGEFNKKMSYTKRIAMCAVLQIANDGRGGDSWGYYCPDKKGEPKIVKGIGEMGKIPAREVAIPRTLMAHTRKSTVGGISLETCHPFDVGSIIGSHNGIISNHSELNKELKRNCKVDSEHIFRHIAENKPLSDLEGYGAITYVNKKAPDKVFMCKLHHGQLAIYGVGTGPEDVHGIIWSSDDAHIDKAIAVAGIPAFEYEIDEGVLYFVRDGNLFKTDKKLAFKEKTYTSAHFSSTGYSGHSSPTTNYRGVDLEDDTDFMEYLRNKYGSEMDDDNTKNISATGTSENVLKLLPEHNDNKDEKKPDNKAKDNVSVDSKSVPTTESFRRFNDITEYE